MRGLFVEKFVEGVSICEYRPLKIEVDKSLLRDDEVLKSVEVGACQDEGRGVWCALACWERVWNGPARAQTREAPKEP